MVPPWASRYARSQPSRAGSVSPNRCRRSGQRLKSTEIATQVATPGRPGDRRATSTAAAEQPVNAGFDGLVGFVGLGVGLRRLPRGRLSGFPETLHSRRGGWRVRGRSSPRNGLSWTSKSTLRGGLAPDCDIEELGRGGRTSFYVDPPDRTAVVRTLLAQQRHGIIYALGFEIFVSLVLRETFVWVLASPRGRGVG